MENQTAISHTPVRANVDEQECWRSLRRSGLAAGTVALDLGKPSGK
jgi:hypothetical protein